MIISRVPASPPPSSEKSIPPTSEKLIAGTGYGQVRDRQVDIRLIAATHQDLGELVREKRFRSDLYFRISTIPLLVPPLRDRGEDIVLLARQLLDQLCRELGRGEMAIAPRIRRA